MPTNTSEFLQKVINFINYASAWLKDNIAVGFIVNFIKAILNLMVAILSFVIDIIQWLIGKI